MTNNAVGQESQLFFSRLNHYRSLAMLLLLSVPLFAAAADEPGETHQVKMFFQVVIRQGPSAGLVASGALTLNIKTGTGNFTGALTPAAAEGAIDPLSSVLFHQVDNKFVAYGEVKEVDVRGTIHGHAINLIALNAGAEGKDIFGVGTTENAFSEQGREQGLGRIAGPAVGPEEGDSGDWIATLLPVPFMTPPAINSASTTTFLDFQTNSFTATSSGVPLPVFSETGTLPAGITFGSNGVLSGTPTQSGTFPITIIASNGVPLNSVQNFTLVVNRPPPTFTSILSPTPVVVANFSIAPGQCSIVGQCSFNTLSLTVTSADNPDTFSTFVANAKNAVGSVLHFNGTLAVGNSAIVNSTDMVATNVNLGLTTTTNPAVTISIAYP